MASVDCRSQRRKNLFWGGKNALLEKSNLQQNVQETVQLGMDG